MLCGFCVFVGTGDVSEKRADMESAPAAHARAFPAKTRRKFYISKKKFKLFDEMCCIFRRGDYNKLV